MTAYDLAKVILGLWLEAAIFFSLIYWAALIVSSRLNHFEDDH